MSYYKSTVDRQNSLRAEGKKINKGIKRICVNCGSSENVEIHHIVPLANGGKDIESNMCALCEKCHALTHGKLQRHFGGKQGRKFKTIDQQIIRAVAFGMCSANYAAQFCDANEATIRRRVVKEFGELKYKRVRRKKPGKLLKEMYEKEEITFLQLLMEV